MKTFSSSFESARGRWSQRILSLATLAVAILPIVTPSVAHGEAAKKKKVPVAAAVDTAPIVAKIKSADPTVIKAGLDEASAAGKGAGAAGPAIEDLLRRGESPELSVVALQALGDVGNDKSSATIRPYARHRNVDLRRAALRALLKTGGKDAVAALREALSDQDAVVRGTAASGLGSLKAREAMPDLFLALDHKVDEAAASIGQLCTVDECEKFAAKMGAIGFDVMTSGFDQVLFRGESDIPDDEKIRVVGRIRELGTGEANKYLRDVQSRWPSGSSPRVRQAIDQAVLATAGGATSRPGGAS